MTIIRLVVVKYPRSGSTYLASMMTKAGANVLFEPSLAVAQAHLLKAHRGSKPAVIFLNDWLHTKRGYDSIQRIIQRTNASTLVMVRGNVFARALSAEKLWGHGTKRGVEQAVITAMKTTAAYIGEFKRMRLQRPGQTNVVFHEQLAFACSSTLLRLAKQTGIPLRPAFCRPYATPISKFHETSLNIPADARALATMKASNVVAFWMKTTTPDITFGHW